MNVICNRNCVDAVRGKCARNEVTISKSGICRNFVESKTFYREDNVVVMDKNGLPSVMVRFTRNPEVKPHPMFLIGGEVYDEIFISKYKNCIIDGLAYSLPMKEPATGMTLEEAEKACFDKGEGWHLMTAMEYGFLANDSLENGTLPHGNTNNGTYHDDPEETCRTYDGFRMLTGTGPGTWTHDHTAFGVEGLCGDIYEWVRGLRLMDGKLEIAGSNDAAMPIDLSENSPLWRPVEAGGEQVYLTAEDGEIRFTTEAPYDMTYGSCCWKDVQFEFDLPEVMKDLGLFAGEPKSYCHFDMEGERMLLRGGRFGGCSNAGIFYMDLDYQRSISQSDVGFRAAYYRKREESDHDDQ